ncbi:MAG: hypothetical protein WAW85_04890 [Gordonia sp. (in: high G+C Gram-positive bacteria)]|uniref:hypothetical protein n=1 Tax=Gordonia sp. (in: high G+C Gram-positive bacteria) TaxID=84139 RepID=UPI003BB759C0
MPRRFAALAAALAITTACLAPAVSSAAPAAEGPLATSQDTGGFRLNLAQVGATRTLTLPGQNTDLPLVLAVPAGTTPVSIIGDASLPAYVTGGDIDVLQGDRLISRTAIEGRGRAPITLPLNGIQVDDTTASVELTLRTHLRTDGYCNFDPLDGLRLTSAEATFTGTPTAPRSVSDFLPAALTKVTFYIPSDPSSAEGAAAVRLGTSIVAHYGSAAPAQIETRALARDATMAPPPAADPLERQVVIAGNLPGGLTLAPGGRYLTLGGDQLENEAEFLSSNIAPLAMASKAIPGNPLPAPQLAREVADLADLGVGDQYVSTVGWPSVSFGIDQTRIGRPVHDVRVQLIGTYTPPPSGSGGRVVVRSGDTVLDSWPAEGSGTFDRWVQIPDDVLHRFTAVTLTVERGDTRMNCGDAYRSSLSLSSAGLIESSAVSSAVPPGFDSLPQALMPRTQLAWTQGDVADVSRAMMLMTGLQRLSVAPLGVDLVAMADVDRLRPAVLIAANGTGLPELTLPVTSQDASAIDVAGVDGQPAVINEPTTPFGSLQVASAVSGSATTLVATSTGAPELLDSALRWLSADPERWNALRGSAMLMSKDLPPVFFVSPAVPEPAHTLSTGGRIGIGIGIVAAIGALGLGVWAALRRRARGPATSPH